MCSLCSNNPFPLRNVCTQTLSACADNPLDERRPELASAEDGCPTALLALAVRCWGDDVKGRPTFVQCVEALKELHTLKTGALGSSDFKRCYDLPTLRVTMASEVFGKVVAFVKLYCVVHGLTSDAQQILLETFIEKLQRETAKHSMVDVCAEAGPAAELLWTSALRFNGMGAHCLELCSLLNRSLRDDNKQLMPATADLVHAINDALCVAGPRKGLARHEFPPGDHGYPPGTTFRGTGFDDRFRSFFENDKKYRVPGLLATSFSRTTAEEFRDRAAADGGPGVLWVVHVDPAGEHDMSKRCKHVNFLSHSHILDARGNPKEAEYLFTAYSVFEVVSTHWAADRKHTVVLRAAPDNSIEDDTLPSAPWY